MGDPIKELYQALKSTNIFLDEEDLKAQLKASPKDVYGIVSSNKDVAGLFVDYDDFLSVTGLKKKDISTPSADGGEAGNFAGSFGELAGTTAKKSNADNVKSYLSALPKAKLIKQGSPMVFEKPVKLTNEDVQQEILRKKPTDLLLVQKAINGDKDAELTLLSNEEPVINFIDRKMAVGQVSEDDLQQLSETYYGKKYLDFLTKKYGIGYNADRQERIQEDFNPASGWEELRTAINRDNAMNGYNQQKELFVDVDKKIADFYSSSDVVLTKADGFFGGPFNEKKLVMPDLKNKQAISDQIELLEQSIFAVKEKKGVKGEKEIQDAIKLLKAKLFQIDSETDVDREVEDMMPVLQTASTSFNNNKEYYGEKVDLKNDGISALHLKQGLNYIKYADKALYKNAIRSLKEEGTLAQKDFRIIAEAGQDIINNKIYRAGAYDQNLVDTQTKIDYTTPEDEKAEYAKLIGEYLKSNGYKNYRYYTKEEIMGAADALRLPKKKLAEELAEEEQLIGYDAIPKTGWREDIARGFNNYAEMAINTISGITKSPAQRYLDSRRDDVGTSQKISWLNSKGQVETGNYLPSERSSIGREFWEGLGGFIFQAGAAYAAGAPFGAAFRVGGAIASNIKKAEVVSGTLGSSYIIARGQAYDNYLQKTGDPGIASIASNFDAAIQAGTEMFLPDVKIADDIARVIKKGYANDIVNLFKNSQNIADLRSGIRPLVKNIINSTVKGSSIIGKENVEELTANIGSFVVESVASPKTARKVDLTEQNIETIRATTISMLAPAILGGIGGSAKEFTKSSFKDAAINIHETKSALDRALLDGEITEGQYDEARKTIRIFRTNLLNAPKVDVNGERLSGKRRDEYAFQKTISDLVSEKTKNEQDDVIKKAIEAKAKEAEKQREVIINPDEENKKENTLELRGEDIDQRWKENIVAIGERTDISEEEKEKLKQAEDFRHAKEVAEFNKMVAAEKGIATDKAETKSEDSLQPKAEDKLTIEEEINELENEKADIETAAAEDGLTQEDEDMIAEIDRRIDDLKRQKGETPVPADNVGEQSKKAIGLQDKIDNIERRRQGLRDLMAATGDDIFILGTQDGTFAGDGLLNLNENGDVVLTRHADSEEGLTKGKGKTENLANIAGQFGGEQIATSGVEGGAQSFINGVVGEYHIPLNELIQLIKDGYVVFAGLGNKEFVLSPHIADKYLTKINGKKINAKYDAELAELEKQAPTPTDKEVGSAEPKEDKYKQTLLKAREGDKKAQDEMNEWGLEWDEKPTKHRQIGEKEAEKLLAGGKITPNENSRNGTYMDVSDYSGYWGDNESFPYRVQFKDSPEFDYQLTGSDGRMRPKNKEKGEYSLFGGYDINDVEKVEKFNLETGKWEIVYVSKNTDKAGEGVGFENDRKIVFENSSIHGTDGGWQVKKEGTSYENAKDIRQEVAKRTNGELGKIVEFKTTDKDGLPIYHVAISVNDTKRGAGNGFVAYSFKEKDKTRLTDRDIYDILRQNLNAVFEQGLLDKNGMMSKTVSLKNINKPSQSQPQVSTVNSSAKTDNKTLLNILPDKRSSENTGKVMITTDQYGNYKTRYIPFSIIEAANKNDKRSGQTAKEINDRGGYGDNELDRLLPGWRDMLPVVNPNTGEADQGVIKVTQYKKGDGGVGVEVKLPKGAKEVFHYSENENLKELEDREGGTWFTDNSYGYQRRGGVKGKVSKVIEPDKLNLASEKDVWEAGNGDWAEGVKKIKEQGFDGIKQTADGDKNYLIFDLKNVKDKSEYKPTTTQETTPVSEAQNNIPNQNQQQNERQEKGQEELLGSDKQQAPDVVPGDNNSGGAAVSPAVSQYRQEWKPKSKRNKYKVTYDKNGKREVRIKGNGFKISEDHPAYNRILREHAAQYNYNVGQTTEAIPDKPQFNDKNEADIWLVENSQNPAEIAYAYSNMERQPVDMSSKEAAISREIGKVKRTSFNQFGDRNKVTFGMAKTYFNQQEGETLDNIAQRASRYGEGLDVTENDVVEFMLKFPYGVWPDSTVKSEAQRLAEDKFEELTGIPLNPGNGSMTVANRAAAQYTGKIRQQVMEAMPDNAEDVDINEVTGTESFTGWKPLEGESLFDNDKNKDNDKATQDQSDQGGDGSQPGNQSSTGQGTRGPEGGSGGTNTGRDSGQEDGGEGQEGRGIEQGQEAGYTIEDFQKEIREIGPLDEFSEDDETPFMAATDNEAKLKAAQNVLAKAQRELNNAEDKIAKTQASQGGMFGQAAQGSMFAVNRDEAGEILGPLREAVKTARAEVDRLTAIVNDERRQADGQMSLFDAIQRQYPPATLEAFNKVQRAIESMFGGISGFKGVKVLTGEDFQSAIAITGADTSFNFMAKPDGTVYGFLHNGTIYINGDHLNLNTPIHEAAHLFTRWAQANAPELYAAGQRLAGTSRAMLKIKADPFYQKQAQRMRDAGRTEAEIEAMFRDEALAFNVGNRGQFIADNQKSSFREWLKKFWNKIKAFFGKSDTKLEKMSAEQFSNMSFDSFSQAMAERILSGERLEGGVQDTGTSFMATINSKGARLAQAVQKLLATGFTEAQVKQQLMSNGFSEMVADNIIANAKRLPKYKPLVKKAKGNIVATPGNQITFTGNTDNQATKAYKAAKRWAKKYFTVNKGLPEFVLPIAEKTRGTQNWAINQAYKTVKQLKEAAKKIGFTDWDAVDAALRGLKGLKFTQPLSGQTDIQLFDPVMANNNRPLTAPPATIPQVLLNMPAELRPIVLKMRAQIDGLSHELTVNGYISPEQALVFEENLGEYVTRTYALFNDKNWAKKLQKEHPEIINEAIQFIYEQRFNEIKQADPTMPDDDARKQAEVDARRKVLDILEGMDMEYNPTKTKTVKGRDNGILQRREDIPEPIRKLMGEYTDPGAAFMQTIARMATLRGQAKFLADIRDIGMGTMFWERDDPNRPDDANVELRSPASATWFPLGGLYTTKEVADFFNEMEYVRNAAVQFWMNFVGAVRWGKTVGSVVTQFKNWESNIGFSIMNGHFYPGESGDAWAYLWDQMKWWNGEKIESDLLTDASQLGLIGQNVGINELRDMFSSDGVAKMITAASTQNPSLLRRLKKSPKQVFEYLNKLYSASDDFFKLYGFVNERKILAKAMYGNDFESLSAEDKAAVNKEAAERVKNTYPTYDRVWEGAKYLSKNMPIFGNFLSFQAESIRVLLNSFQYAINDLKNPAMRSAGLRRIAGITTYLGSRYAILYAIAQVTGFGMKGLFGGDDDDKEQAMEDISRFTMPFMANSEKLVRNVGPGKYVVYDLMSIEPYGIWFKTINALRDGLPEGISEFFGPFMEKEMTFETYQKLAANESGRGGRIFDPNDPLGNKVKDGLAFAWQQLKPSTVGFIQRAIQRDDKFNEAMALMGARGYSLDVTNAFSIKVYKAEEEKAELVKDFFAAIKPLKDKAEIEKVVQEFKGKLIKVTKELAEDRLAALRLGADQEEIDERIYKASKKMIDVWGTDEIMLILGETDEAGFIFDKLGDREINKKNSNSVDSIKEGVKSVAR